MPIIVKYVDLDNNFTELATSGNLDGKRGERVEYSTADEIKKLCKQNFLLVDNRFDANNEVHFFNSDEKEYRVIFKHAREVITADNLEYGCQENEVQLRAKQIVHYMGTDQKIPDNVVEANFNRKIIYDKVTNKKTYTQWQPEKQSFPLVAAPAVLGYTPDRTTVGGEKATIDKLKYEYVVTYVPNKRNARRQKAEIKFIDIDNQNSELMSSGELKGKPNTPIPYNTADIIQKLNEQNYEVVNNDFDPDGNPALFGNSRNYIQTFLVTLKHKLAIVNSDHPSPNIDKKSYEKEVQRKIIFSGAGDDTPKEVIQVATLKRNLTIDLVTQDLLPDGKYTSDWQSKETYPPVQVPVVSGFYTRTQEILSRPVIKENITEEIKYYPNGYLIAVNSNNEPFKDIAKKRLITNPIDSTKAVFPKIEVENAILKSLNDQDVVNNPGKDYLVQYEVIHKYVPVDQERPREEINPAVYRRIATARIQYQGAGEETPAISEQTVQWNRTVTYDEVTHELVEDGMYTTEWTANKSKFEAVPTPVVKGYCADIGLIGEHPVTKTDLIATITYRPLGKMIPVDEHHNVIKNAPHLTYVNDPYDPVRVLMTEEVPNVEGYTPINSTISVNNPFVDQYVTYTLNPRYIPVNSDHPYRPIKPTLYSVMVKENIIYQGAGNQTPVNRVQAAKWSRTLTVNENNGELIENGKYTTSWAVDKTKYLPVQTPIIDGYHADLAIVKEQEVKKADYEIVVTYKKNGRIIPVDSKGRVLSDVEQPFYVTDPLDATKIMEKQGVPRIMNYIPERETVTIKNAEKDIRVTYYTFSEMKEIKGVLNKVEEKAEPLKKKDVVVKPNSEPVNKVKKVEKIKVKDSSQTKEKKRKSIFPWRK